MTKEGAKARAELVLEVGPLGPFEPERRAACARLLARLAVEKAYRNLALDNGRTMCCDVGNPHKKGRPTFDATNIERGEAEGAR